MKLNFFIILPCLLTYHCQCCFLLTRSEPSQGIRDFCFWGNNEGNFSCLEHWTNLFMTSLLKCCHWNIAYLLYHLKLFRHDIKYSFGNVTQRLSEEQSEFIYFYGRSLLLAIRTSQWIIVLLSCGISLQFFGLEEVTFFRSDNFDFWTHYENFQCLKCLHSSLRFLFVRFNIACFDNYLPPLTTKVIKTTFWEFLWDRSNAC